MKRTRKSLKKLLGFMLSTALILQSSGVQVLAESPSDLGGEESVYEAVSEEAVSEGDIVTVSEGDAADEKVDVSEGDTVSAGDAVSGNDVVSDGTDVKVMADTEGTIGSGKWLGMDWSIDKDGRLIIEGEFDDEEYREWIDSDERFSSAPEWNHSYSESITSVKVTASGVKDTQYWFSGCWNIKSIDLSEFDTSQVTNMAYMFSKCVDLTDLDVSKFDTSQVTKMSYMFDGCSSLTSLDVSGFKTSQVTAMNGMFYGCYGLTELDVSGFDTSQVTNMAYMFATCSGITNLDVSRFDTSNVTNMWSMFSNCHKLASLDLSNFKTGQVTSMDDMFFRCESLTELDVSGFDTGNVTNMNNVFLNCSSLTNLTIGNMNTSQAMYMQQMFANCSSLTSLDVSGLNTSQVTNMWGMFKGCSNLTDLDVSGFDTSNVTSMSYMFKDCSSLTSLDVSGLNTSQVATVTQMFDGCSSLTQLNLSSFDLSRLITWTSQEMFEGCTALEQLDTPKNLNISIKLPYTMYDADMTPYTELPIKQSTSIRLIAQKLEPVTGTFRGMDWVIDENGMLTISGQYQYDGTEKEKPNWCDQYYISAKVTATGVKSTYYWFGHDTSGSTQSALRSVDLSEFDTSQVTDMSYMFYECNKLTGLDLSHFNTGNVTDMNHMFDFSNGITSLNLSNFNTSNVTDMSCMFGDSYWVTAEERDHGLTRLDLSSFDTANVTNMSGMFAGCSSLMELIFGDHFDTGKVTDMSFMFTNCRKLSYLDVSGFKTNNVKDMWAMFSGCSSLTELAVSGFDTGKVTRVGSMFGVCESLTNLDLSGFDLSAIENDISIEYLLLGCTSLVTINTPKNVKVDINLPHTMYDEDGNAYNNLPLNRADSIQLTRIINYSYQIAPIPAQTYTGKAIKPEVTVTYGSQTLTLGTDYTVTYKNNINAAKVDDTNAPTVTVNGKGSYGGTLTATFTIEAKELTEDNTTISSMVYVADGKTKQIIPTVTLDGKKLSVNKDFTVEWPDAKNADGSPNDKAYKEPDEYSVIIKGTGNYQGTLTATLTILKTDQVPASKLKVASIPAQTYAEDASGKAVAAEPAPKVTYSGKELTLNQDYEITYRGNDKAGKATLIITGLKNTAEGGTYVCGTLEKTFTIKGTAISKAKLTYRETGTKSYSPAYTGSEIRPEITLTVGEKTLKEKKDYTISYTNNVKAGKATIILTGIGGYTGTSKKTFTIKPASDVADRLKVTFAGGKAQASYSQSGAKPAIIVTLDGTELEIGKDYTVSYKNNKKLAASDAAKAPTLVLKGKGNYKFQKEVTFAIVEKDLKDGDISATAPDKFVGGKGSMLSAPVVTDGNGKKLKANKDYTVTGYEVDGRAFDGTGTLASGTTVTVKLTGTGSYKGEISTTYRIASMDLSKVKVNKPQLEYNNGEPVEFTEQMLKEGILTVTYKGKDASGNKVEQALTYGKDYIITDYKNNIKKGTATVTIQGINEYGGTKTVKFSIVSKKLQ